MKQITYNTILKQNGKEFSTIESDGVIYWRDEFLSIVAQSQPKLDGVPVISLDSYIKNLAKEINSVIANDDTFILGYISNHNQYTQKDIEKAINLATTRRSEDTCLFFTKEEIFKQINSISIIEIDEQFNIISYE